MKQHILIINTILNIKVKDVNENNKLVINSSHCFLLYSYHLILQYFLLVKLKDKYACYISIRLNVDID